MGEFELIRRHFQRAPAAHGASTAVVLGIGDDCALLQPSPGHLLAISSDMLVEGRHFFADVDPEALGHKALAVNLSDLAAMGARPLGFTLALALPHADSDWLARFARGLFALADAHACPLVGGDTTRGPLNLCITVFGEVKPGQALRRDAARAGDDLYVSGRTGEARLALEAMRGTLTLPPGWLAAARTRLEQPTPRVALGLALRGIASAAIDISDGLIGDLGHILQSSRVGAHIDTALAADLLAGDVDGHRAEGFLHPEARLACVLAGGDDYELAFTAPVSARAAVEAAALQAHTPVSCIGRIESAPGLRLVDAASQPVSGNFASFDHFA